MKVLLVDDDPFNREGVKLYLEQRGLEVVEAGDAQTAWDTANTIPLDVAIIDIVIPEMPNKRFQVDRCGSYCQDNKREKTDAEGVYTSTPVLMPRPIGL